MGNIVMKRCSMDERFCLWSAHQSPSWGLGLTSAIKTQLEQTLVDSGIAGTQSL